MEPQTARLNKRHKKAQRYIEVNMQVYQGTQTKDEHGTIKGTEQGQVKER